MNKKAINKAYRDARRHRKQLARIARSQHCHVSKSFAALAQQKTRAFVLGILLVKLDYGDVKCSLFMLL